MGMDIFFQDPDDAPLPPEEVHIRDLSAEPYSDGRRVRVILKVAPFQKRPDAEVVINGPDGEPVASASVVETVDPNLELTLHLRGPGTAGRYKVQAAIHYRPEDESANGEPDSQPPPDPKVMEVDRAETTFELP